MKMKSPVFIHVPPEEIEARSLAIIDAEVPEPRPFVGEEWIVARRMIHTTADFDLLHHICFHPGAIEAGKNALRYGANIVTDTRMALSGIPLRRITPLGGSVRCFIDDPQVTAQAKVKQVTRSWAAMDMVMENGGADIFVIGNAPTALARLLSWLEQGARPPKLVVGMPVGFVNAVESKEMLCAQKLVPFITIVGRKGGSSLAASVINALAELVLEQGT